MAELDRTVLEFYQISNPYPVEWPADKGNSDASDDDDDEGKERKAKLNRRKSRYQALERAATHRSSNSMIPGSEKGNLVQRGRDGDVLAPGRAAVRVVVEVIVVHLHAGGERGYDHKPQELTWSSGR